MRYVLGFIKILWEGFVKVLPAFLAYHLGATREEKKQAEEALEDVKEAKDIRDRLDTDPDYADELRKKYTRREE